MTMDVSNNRKVELKSSRNDDQQQQQQTDIVTTKTKRPFDVAFLMQPDDKTKQKQKTFVIASKSDSDDEDVEVENDSESEMKYFCTQKQQIFDDPNLIKNTKLTLQNEQQQQQQKSAFTKVSLIKEARNASPNLSLSPDINYQNSLSPSPPIITNRTYANFTQNMLAANHLLKQQHHSSSYQNSFVQENPFANNSTTQQQQQELLQPNFKMRPLLNYRPDLTSYNNYAQFQSQQQEMLKIAQQQQQQQQPTDVIIRNPAAAILHSLLPPSLAALSLPAQNVCAKCNITFRMTSDLVYHMRSHHKNDSIDYTKKRREDKLKCPVCAESFRERHHLTRHMTAHQDKDNDDLDTNHHHHHNHHNSSKNKTFNNYK